MGNTPSSPHPKTDLYPYLGYGAISPNSPGFDEQAFFDDIIDQPLVAGEKPTVKKRKSWESAMSSSNKSQRFSLDTAIDSAIVAWQRVKPRRGSYDKISNKQMVGIDWEAK
ncbi:hypothetical protein N0V93_005394 [Gnomoniopsis smithogilvyi]|uniref:Uncharacterized protein n=1 Tax=Gnomoniopsis smithogilvyi TaxID=1191159 RepID=A0A9W9CY10_9PEZI|nr:hypothetical protein N0V93_005394 [Gnomoniopsis smithogilvyi]